MDPASIPDYLLAKLYQHAGEGTSTDPANSLPRATVEEIKAALAVIPADCSEEEWWRVGAALCNHFGDTKEGFAVFHEWSATGGPSYKGERDCQNKWGHCAKKEKIHIATLFHVANQYDPSWRDGVAPEPKGPENPSAEEPSNLCLIESSLLFTSSFTPPDYLIDEVLQRRFVYSMTAPTGGGKTSLALCMAAHLDLGRPLGGHEVEKCKVLFLAGENPDDVCMRWIKLCEELELDHSQVGVHFLPHVVSLTDRNTLARIQSESAAAGPFGAVFVDTSAAYNEAEDENNNIQMAKHARALRSLIQVVDGGPTVIATTHPVKNANMENLLPRGGGAFLAEVDGNLVCHKVPDSMAVDLHWHGKFRGPDFSPIPFQLRPGTTDRLKTSKGKLIWTVTAMPITAEQRAGLDDKAVRDQDDVLIYMSKNPSASFGEIASGLGWMQRDGSPYKMRVSRVIKAMAPSKLVEKGTGERWVLTKKGEKESEAAKARLETM